MFEEEKIIRGNNMVLGTAKGFDPYVNSSANTNEFFSFEQHNSDLFWKASSLSSFFQTGHNGRRRWFSQFDDQSYHQRCSGAARYQTAQYNLRSSRYLVPAQDLLNEFCNLRTKENDRSTKAKTPRTNQCQDQDNLNDMNADSSKNMPLNSLEFLELQKRKSKLLQMLDEVDRKYHNYCDQMKAVVSSFEAVAGNDAATVYSALASKAMSRHFRCLRDGIVGQIKATKKAMGEKDISTPGATRGETPRLRLLDQTLRQQRLFSK
ncbi:hypothetical protein E3N88_16767 [Mikania micrantha]|uniref:POX domain-containing protein n=1 Tax=Mikania micrantha TaxID=192012 RepID=A0A5N6NQ27_9ASTR|nr:hypothetical protein E3N88_16767 [Mikania micrantha]